MKKLIYSLRAALIALMFLATFLASAHSFEVDGIYYNKTSDTDVTVTYRGNSYSSYSDEYTGDVVIPSTVSYNSVEYLVTSIGYDAFNGCRELNSVIIPNSVTTIGSSAFSNCSGLTSISIGNSVNTIQSKAFENCERLTSIVIPNSVTAIWDEAFLDCSALKEITFNDGNQTLLLYTDDSYSANYPFSGCHIEKIYLGRNIDEMGSGLRYGFWGRQLKEVTIAGSVTYIRSDLFNKCEKLTSVTIPNSVKSIGRGAFRDCRGLTSIYIGNTVETIDFQAFYNCNSLTSVTCLATTPPNIYAETFGTKTTRNAILYVPSDVVNEYKNANLWKDFYNIQAITNGIDEIIIDMDKNMSSVVDVDIYTLNGTHVYNGPRSEARLAKGFYLVRQGEAVAKVYVE